MNPMDKASPRLDPLPPERSPELKPQFELKSIGADRSLVGDIEWQPCLPSVCRPKQIRLIDFNRIRVAGS